MEITDYCDHKDGLDTFHTFLSRAADLDPKYFFCEVGTYRGGSALFALNIIEETNKDRWLITIDPYGTKPHLVGNKVRVEEVYDEDIYREAMANLAFFSRKHGLNHTHFRMTSNDFMKMFDDMDFYYNEEKLEKKFAFVYLDGDHTPEQVEKELEYFYPRTVKGGVIVLDDVPYVEGQGKYFNKVWEGKKLYDNFRLYYVKD